MELVGSALEMALLSIGHHPRLATSAVATHVVQGCHYAGLLLKKQVEVTILGQLY